MSIGGFQRCHDSMDSSPAEKILILEPEPGVGKEFILQALLKKLFQWFGLEINHPCLLMVLLPQDAV